MLTLKADKSPAETLALTNRVTMHPTDHAQLGNAKHVIVRLPNGQQLVFTVEATGSNPAGCIGFNTPHRRWGAIEVTKSVQVMPYQNQDFIASMTVTIDFNSKKKTTKDSYNTDDMLKEFLTQFPSQTFSQGQQGFFQFGNLPLLSFSVKDMEVATAQEITSGKKARQGQVGISLPDTMIVFEKGAESAIFLAGKSKGKAQARQSIINPDWDFSKMGIGGLDDQFNTIFRRAFASRVFPPEIIEQLGCKHVKGVLLFGPPGTGKTLMARQIGQMLNAREPKIVNGPEVLDKYVGESEAKIRALFAEAEAEERSMGPLSGLHIIIFDEIDAICKARGSLAGSSGVNDTVVNQLLSKIDGVEQLNNILVIGMTNRKDMIDEALMRPGRLEVQIEIGLPKENGRAQILTIHTRKMRTNEKLHKDVDLKELAALTKNFSGAEIEGLVRAAQSRALNRLVRASSKVEIDPDAAENLMINMADFRYALDNDVKPAFGASQEILESYLSKGITVWGQPVKDVIEDGELLIRTAKNSAGTFLVSMLLEGAPNAGKTALAARLAMDSGFPFVKICSPDAMAGYTESAKCMQIRKIFDDAYRSDMSCVVVDNLESLIDYGPIGPRYSNLTLQTLLVLLKKQPPKGKRLLIICTTSRKEVLQQMEMLSAFTDVLHVSNLGKAEHIERVVATDPGFSDKERQAIRAKLDRHSICIGVKKLQGFLDMVKEVGDQNKVNKLICKLEEEGYATPNL